jgi:ATP synthase protein I
VKKSSEGGRPNSPERLEVSVGKKARRKLKARTERRRSLWFGVGMFGLVGWSIAIPVLVAVALGQWIDHTWPSRISWTLTLLFVGTVVGCIHAWKWIKRDGRGG